MPITPHFDISQTDDHVQIDIRVPHVRVSGDSVQVVLTDDNRCLHFASPPYLLVLTFEEAFQDNADESCAQYDPFQQHGLIVLKLAKATRQHWVDLDMVGALVQPKKTNLQNFVTAASEASPQKSTWIKEILDEADLGDDGQQHETDSEFSKGPQQQQQQETTDSLPTTKTTTTGSGYGFGRMFRGVFTDLARDGLAREMLEVPVDNRGNFLVGRDSSLRVLSLGGGGGEGDDEGSSETRIRQQQPKEERQKMEASKFSQERYLQDLDIQDDYLYQAAMDMRPHWIQPPPQSKQQSSPQEQPYFSAKESARLSSIPYPLLPPFTNKTEERHLWLGILDLLFAYCYDHLLTGGDPTVESAWTVSILSVSLSWLESFDDHGDEHNPAEQVVHQSIRRSLIYPFVRNVEFAIYIWKQVQQIIVGGNRRCVIRCLLQLRNVLDQSELYYLGNKLYIDPYLAWLQDSRRHEEHSGHLVQLSKDIDDTLSDAEVLRERIGLDLPKIELEAFGDVDDASSSTTSSDSDDEESSEEGDDDERSNGESKKDDENDEAKCSSDLLDQNFGSLKPGLSSSLLVDMSKLSLEGKPTESNRSDPPKAPGSLIQEIS